MNFHTLMAYLIVLTTFVGCGDDIARKQKSKNTGRERSTPGATGDDSLVSSQIHRLRSFNVISYAEEIALTLSSTLPDVYRAVPNIQLDDEGTNNQNVVTMVSVGRPGVVCGIGEDFTGVNSRISDCANKNKDNAMWSGYLYGAAGESTWKLVAFTSTKKEIWEDLRTGMIWSDVVATGNWCKASGNKQKATTTSTVDCSVQGEDQSFCSGANIEGLGQNVVWRLPTRNDYLQADINGIRFVMKQGSDIGSWTATLQAASEDREHAWVYHLTDGTLEAQELTSERLVRCIGAPIR